MSSIDWKYLKMVGMANFPQIFYKDKESSLPPMNQWVLTNWLIRRNDCTRTDTRLRAIKAKRGGYRNHINKMLDIRSQEIALLHTLDVVQMTLPYVDKEVISRLIDRIIWDGLESFQGMVAEERISKLKEWLREEKIHSNM